MIYLLIRKISKFDPKTFTTVSEGISQLSAKNYCCIGKSNSNIPSISSSVKLGMFLYANVTNDLLVMLRFHVGLCSVSNSFLCLRYKSIVALASSTDECSPT